jgi:hypothetical protein
LAHTLQHLPAMRGQLFQVLGVGRERGEGDGLQPQLFGSCGVIAALSLEI